jgi:predicted MFS family arabinose efflux permease
MSCAYAGVCLGSSWFARRSENGLRWAFAGCVLFGLFFPASLLFHNTYWFGANVVVGMGAMALFWPAMQSWLGTEPNPAIRAKRIGVYNLSWTLGLGLGSLAGGWLYDFAYWLPFAVVFVCSITAAAFVWSLPHEKRRFDSGADDDNEHHSEQDVQHSESFMYAAWLANLVVWAYIGVLRNVYPKRIDELVEAKALLVFGESAAHSDWFTAARVSAYLALSMYLVHGLLSVQLGRMRFWRHRLWVLIVFQVLGAAAFHMLGRTSEFSVMWLCFVAVGVSCSVCFFASLSYSISRTHAKHTRAAIHEGMVGVGGLAGSFTFGQLSSLHSLTWPFLMTPLFLLAPLIIEYLLLAFGRKRFQASG